MKVIYSKQMESAPNRQLEFIKIQLQIEKLMSVHSIFLNFQFLTEF